MKRRVRAWVPPWLTTVDAVAWVSGPDRRLVWLNSQAATLLGKNASDCAGQMCDAVIAGLDASGAPFCSPLCDARKRAVHGRPNPPLSLRVCGRDGVHASLLVWILAVNAPDGSGPWLVHVATSSAREERLEQYLSRVATRTPAAIREAIRALSPREREILELLSADLTLRSVALRTGLSYTTVRNHVQHLLRKLDAHSIAEAVARWVLRT